MGVLMTINRFSSVVFIFILLVGCDPGSTLLVKNGNHSKTVKINKTIFTYKINTLRNINFSLKVDVATDNEINIYTDSLKIYFKDKNISYEIRYDGERYKSKTINVNQSTKSFYYGFDIDKTSVRKNDEIILFAKNYIKEEDSFFDLDTVKFMITKNFVD